jgi:aminoglycoside phosphotransferase family enzyme/predicted kinase
MADRSRSNHHRGTAEVPADTNTLICRLQDPGIYDHVVHDIVVVETHISWVILTGPYAYKIKKPVDLGFLDFSTLEKRHFYCREELRLNRRLAPHLYIDVVNITGTCERPALNTPGEAIEYAVRMVQFPQEAQLDRVAARGALRDHHIDRLASTLAAFHGNVEVAAPRSHYGEPAQVHRVVTANFERVLTALTRRSDRNRVQALRAWSQAQYERHQDVLWRRKQNGFIRECHGDMHLRNMALLDGEILIFDCIEFNAALRWIDVMSETAFLVMDLDDRGHSRLARRFLNAYLEHTGDYAGLQLLRYYLVYRAMVRAMVDMIRANQAGLERGERRKVLKEYASYIALTENYTHVPQQSLIITHGFSGSGKTTATQALLERTPVIRIRSDIERKRLHRLAPDARTCSNVDRGLYSAPSTRDTYAGLAGLAAMLLDTGFSVIVDAAFLSRAQRDIFRDLAQRRRLPFYILDCEASEDILRKRVLKREREGRDASEADAAVLAHQLATHEPLTQPEQHDRVAIDTTQPITGPQITEALRLHRQARRV